MIKQKEEGDNPYQPPSSNLSDESEKGKIWSYFAIKCAKNHQRAMLFGICSALFASLLATMILDIVLSGTTVGIFDGETLSIWMVFTFGLIGGFLGSEFSLRYQRKRNSVQKYISMTQASFQNWPYKPIVITIFLPLVTVLCILPGVYEEIRGALIDRDVDFTVLAMKSRALLILPFMMPITYMLAKASKRRAEYWLKKMVQSR